MDRWLERTALGLGITGWVCSVFTRFLALWTVSGTVNNVTAALPAYWDGAWLDWDHWDLAHDGSLHCSFYQRLMSLSGNFRSWRTLIVAAIGTGAFAVAVGATGLARFPNRGQVKVASGVLFVLAGVLLLVPIAWTCHHTSLPLEGAEDLRRDWGPALYFGWVSFGLMVAGGAFLLTRCPRSSQEPSGSEPVSRSPGEESENPLNSIHRTALTLSQYGRRSEPI
ncbi:hypothetical protein NHX12_009364 [Muraenolepis orangiensis]|uniref:Claudin n=1 Tax=Muraenolepis orangiensis TaxID=630683 RepID=A0A9Q0DN61_9TELE|nr:hypothetical protein NHX12_009364 [Muraenolepis orangiensis]